ncbi:MAG: hypothetical protein IIY55_07885 [Blautia sp.]|nr:hypothetical protein [Blautia sp.]
MRNDRKKGQEPACESHTTCWQADRGLRVAVYVAGLIVLALGLVLNTKTGLGTAPLVSPAFVISQLTGFSFANVTFVVYSGFVLIELVLHLIRKDRKRMLNDLLQLPFALVFTRFMKLFDAVIPSLAGDGAGPVRGTLWCRLAVLAVALFLIGLGACLSMRMRLIPNPGDGAVLAISDFFGIRLGLAKNIFDISCVVAAAVIGLIFRGQLIGVGIGTVLAMLFVGRIIDLVGGLFEESINRLTGTKKGTVHK